ncbi:hypothetical protein C7S14_1144 [Burkholderia cepacia]|nr:hypothetical protein [Burkholderia cepacia]QOH36884.1 hypothetical protein C7S14_1144 [Burkholderia cepacia]
MVGHVGLLLRCCDGRRAICTDRSRKARIVEGIARNRNIL